MALAFALMAVLPVFATTATIDIDKDFVAADGTFTVEVEDQDVDTTVVKWASLTWDGDGDANLDALEVDTFDLTGENAYAPDTGVVIGTAQAIDTIAVVDSTFTTDIDETSNFAVSIFSAEDGLISIQTFADLDGLLGEASQGAGTDDYMVNLKIEVASEDTINVKVTSVSDKTGITVTATETALASGIFKVDVAISGVKSASRPADYNADNDYDVDPAIWAAPGETVTAKYSDVDSDGESEGTRSTSVVVEANDVLVTVVDLADEALTTDVTPTLTVEFTDLDSGVKASTITFNIVDADPGVAGDVTGEETVETTEITDGFRAVVTLGGPGAWDDQTTLITWNADAEDEAGNSGRTDSDSGTSGDQDHTFIIDKEGPDFEGATATAGVFYDADDDAVETDPSKSSSTTIGIQFPDTVGTVEEALDGGTITASDFEIDDLDLPGGTQVSNVTPLAATVVDGFENWIFLTVQEMSPDAKPTVVLKSGISDAAGNTTSIGELAVDDGQAPRLTVTVSDELDDDKTTVTIVSNEALAQNPTVVANQGDATEVATATADVEATNTWALTLDPGTELGPYSIVVKAKDTAQNEAAVGNAITTEDWPTSKSIAFFSDDALADADADCGTEEACGSTGHELAIPFFITLDFSAEAAEYGLDASDDVTNVAANVETDLDEHETVSITEIALDGEDISSMLDTQDDIVFTLALQDIEVGDHELIYTAEDEAGNEVEDKSIEFTVTARKAYSVAMAAGWNLISLPGTPQDPSVDAVLPSSHPATNVLTFADGAWQVASRPAGGEWDGSLTEIDGLHAYWVNTTSSAPVKALLELPAAGTANTLPTVPVVAGWNLVPVIDLAQTKQTDGDATKTGATYFTSIAWSVAYTYDAKTRTWTRITPSNGKDVTNGDGVWVWATRRGTLIP